MILFLLLLLLLYFKFEIRKSMSELFWFSTIIQVDFGTDRYCSPSSPESDSYLWKRLSAENRKSCLRTFHTFTYHFFSLGIINYACACINFSKEKLLRK